MEEIKLPKMGQSVEEAEIVTWLKQEGDSVAVGEALFTMQTDKAEIDCESTAAGVLRKILVQPGIETPVLSVVALVGAADEPLPDLALYQTPSGGEQPGESDGNGAEAPAEIAPVAAAQAPAPEAAGDGGRVRVSPRARRVAADQHIDPARLAGSGVGGRVLAADVQAYATQLKEAPMTPTARRVAGARGLDPSQVQGTGIGGKITKNDIPADVPAARPAQAPAPQEAAVAPGGVRRVPLTPMRRIIARRMAESKFSAPHYYVTVEVDMAAAKTFRATLKHFKASYNDLVLYAVTQTLREFPAVNARWAGDAVEELADVNLGVAVALKSGLIVPVLRQAQHLSLEGLCANTKVLVEKAQSGKLAPDDYAGNTFTVSNLGPFGVDSFTAIINQPDSAILAIGQMKDQVVVIDGGMHIRPIMKLTLSSDHRVIDGALAALFMGSLKERLEAGEF